MAVWGELIGREPAESWRSLRGRRATPPIPVTNKPRLSTFRAALEQAEQQFNAAATIGYDSRPLNLFYGLSQAGRAVAAACRAATGDDWRLEGHGILAREMNNAASVGDVVLFSQPGQKGSFQRLSQLLDSPVPAGEPTKSVTGAMTTQWRVEDVWPYLVEAQYRARLDPSGIHLPLQITLPPQEAFSPGGATYPNGAYGAESILPIAARPQIDDTTLANYLDCYPILKTRQGVGPMWGESQFRVIWENDNDHKQTIHHESFTLYRGGRYAFPAMGNDSRALHPLMAWWAVLFALSMLARYQPDQWTKMINVDQHPQATSLEYVLDLAIRAVPDLVDETIVAVST